MTNNYRVLYYISIRISRDTDISGTASPRHGRRGPRPLHVKEGAVEAIHPGLDFYYRTYCTAFENK